MKCVAAFLILLVTVHAAGVAAHSAAIGSVLSAKLTKQARELANQAIASFGGAKVMGVGDSSPFDACTFPDMASVTLDTLLQKSAAKAACKATHFSAYTSAVNALNATATITPSGNCASPSLGLTATCTKTYTYPSQAARDSFKTSVANNAQPGHAIGVEQSMRMQASVSMSMNGQSFSGAIDVTEVEKGMIAAMANACDANDARALAAAIAAMTADFNTALASLTTCVKAAAAASGVSLSFSMAMSLDEVLYTQLDASDQPMQSSKVEGQGTVRSGAAALAAPAHVWLLAAVAALALLFAKLA